MNHHGVIGEIVIGRLMEILQLLDGGCQVGRIQIGFHSFQLFQKLFHETQPIRVVLASGSFIGHELDVQPNHPFGIREIYESH